MYAGTSKIDITPSGSVWMDGMIRTHRSEGVHDHLQARCLVLSNTDDLSQACIIVSAEIVSFSAEEASIIRAAASRMHGIPQQRILLAATHTHSGPATIGFFNPAEPDYITELRKKIAAVIGEAIQNLQPVAFRCASGEENTISHYRRLLTDDGRVVMNWESIPSEKIVKPLGEIDPQLGVLKLTKANNPDELVCILFNHAGHPNIMSGENYYISGDYPGYAARLLEEEHNCVALFVNGAQGTMDIDGLRDRDWEGVARAGTALAKATSQILRNFEPTANGELSLFISEYTIPKREISSDMLKWSDEIIDKTGGSVQSLADGVGNDFLAKLYKKIHDDPRTHIEIQQICIKIGETAFISFPGELFTEIGMDIKAKSPFRQTYFLGLVNGKVGYIPTRKAISEGGYAVDTRQLDDTAESIITEKSIELLKIAHQ